MDNKVVSLFEESKNVNNEPLPIERTEIMHNLNEISDDVLNDFLNHITKYLDDSILLRNIVATRCSPIQCQHLIDTLDKYQFNRLRKLAESLSAEEPISKIDEILEAALGIVTPTSLSINMATNLVDFLKEQNIDYVKESKRIAETSRSLKLLSYTLTLLDEGHDKAVIERLSQAPQNDIEMFHHLSSVLAKHKQGA